MGNFSNILALTAGLMGAAMPIAKEGNVARRGELLLGPLTSCTPPVTRSNQTCVRNETHYHVSGGGGDEYVASVDGTAPTIYINPKTPPTTQNKPPIIPNAAILAGYIVAFCSSALFWGCVYRNRSQIFTSVIEPIRQSLLGPTSRADARSAQIGDVEMEDFHASHSAGSLPPSSNSNHSPSATLGHPTAGITERTEGNYRNV